MNTIKDKMILLNMFGGPGSGKSTASAALFVALKNAGYRTELVGEVARDFIYKGQTAQFDNQLYIFGKQYSRIRNLERVKCAIAISDSPLIQGCVYGEQFVYTPHMKEITKLVEAQYEVYNIFVKRTKEFSDFGRNQGNLEEAVAFDKKMYDCVNGKFDLEITGDLTGQRQLIDWMFGMIE